MACYVCKPKRTNVRRRTIKPSSSFLLEEFTIHVLLLLLFCDYFDSKKKRLRRLRLRLLLRFRYDKIRYIYSMQTSHRFRTEIPVSPSSRSELIDFSLRCCRKQHRLYTYIFFSFYPRYIMVLE